MAKKLADHQLLWIDLDGRTKADLDAIAEAVGIDAKLAERLATEVKRADLTQYEAHIHLVIQAMEPPVEGDAEGSDPIRRALDIVAGRDWVVTIHDGPLKALERRDALTEGETRLGALDAAGFVAGIADEVLADYF
ncbi:MAG: CorA family divalent cation transporter, partial [Chloroflexota bacterium]